MLKAGYKHKLHLARFTDNGAYLMDEELNEVLLPNRYVAKNMQVGDTVEVFVYHDSEDRIVASTDMPLVLCGEIDALEVVDISSFGVFLDWGLPKDLFLPRSNCTTRLHKGDVAVVGLYTDNVTGRVVATTKLGQFVSNDQITVEEGEKVRIVVAFRVEAGFRVVVNDKNWGMIYDNQIFSDIEVGDSLWAWVVRVTPDKRIDIALSQPGFDGVKESATELLEKINAAAGMLPLNDKSSPEEIYAALNLSKKVFKRAVGVLLKNGDIEQRDGAIYVIQNKK